MTSSLTIREATPDDLLAFYGAVPGDRLEALVGEADGQILAVSGIYWHGLGAVAFADFAPAMFQRRKDIVRGCRIVLDYLRAKGFHRVYAIADTQIPSSRRFLDWIGFRPTGHMSEIGEYLVLEV